MAGMFFIEPLSFFLAFSLSATAAPTRQSLLKPFPSEPLLNEVVAFLPTDHHHINLKAPNGCGGADLIGAAKDGLRCEFTAPGRFEARIYVCDDKETFCTVQKAAVTVGGVSEAAGASHPKHSAQSPNKPLPGFLHNDLSMAREEAQKQGRPILMLFTQQYCPPCNLFEEASLGLPEFLERTQDLVLLQMDADIDLPHEIEQLGLLGTPTLVLFDSDLRELSRTTLSGSPYLVRKWVDQELKFKNVPIAETRARYASAPQSLSDAELFRLARWDLEQDELSRAKEELSRIKSKDAPERALSDRVDADLAKGPDFLTAAGRFVGEAQDCQQNSPLWSLVGGDAKAASPAGFSAAVSLLDRADAAAAAQQRPELAFDCLLNQAYLMHIRARFYQQNGKEAEALKYAQAASDLYGKFQRLIPGGNGEAPKMAQAGLWSDLKKPQAADAVYQGLVGEEPGNFSFEYLEAGDLFDQKRYDQALAALAKAEPKAKANEWIKIQRLKVEILIAAGRKEEARAQIRALLSEVRLPKSQPSPLHRFVAFLRQMQDKIQAD